MPRLARPMAKMGHKAIFKASDQDENRLKSKVLSAFRPLFGLKFHINQGGNLSRNFSFRRLARPTPSAGSADRASQGSPAAVEKRHNNQLFGIYGV